MRVWCGCGVSACGTAARLPHRRDRYGVASDSRIDKIIGLFCKRAIQKRRYSAKETYDFIDPTDRSHPIAAPIAADMA